MKSATRFCTFCTFGAGHEAQGKEDLSFIMNRKIPKFKSEAEERKFWSSHDSVDYIDWRGGKRAILPDLRPSVRAISIRLPQAMIDELKLVANRRDVPY